MYVTHPSSSADERLWAAWQEQVTTAAPSPWLARTLVARSDTLLPRFAAWYGQLQALPRRVRRTLQRQLALSLAGVALLLALGQAPGQAATIPVNTTNPTIAHDRQCSLGEAIVNANNDAPIHPDCPAGRGADTIVLPQQSVQRLTGVDNRTYGPTGLPVIMSKLAIVGNESILAREAMAPDAFRLLAVGPDGQLSLQNLTLRGGLSSEGGALFNDAGTVTVTECKITGNTAINGGGIGNYGGTLTMTASEIRGNTAYVAGGGIRNIGGDVIVTNSEIVGNTAYVAGGGIAKVEEGNGGGIANIFGGKLTVRNSGITGNTAKGSGGGIFNNDSDLTVTESHIMANEAGSGGGICHTTGTVTVTDSSITGNVDGCEDDRMLKSRYGGAIANDGTLTVTKSHIMGNTAENDGRGSGNNR